VITATEDKNYGLSLATSVLGRGSLWACEWGNTGMIYEIDPTTGEVLDVLMPICGDMLFGMTYNAQLDTFTGIMDMYLYVDLELTHEEQEKILDSVVGNEFTYHKLNLLPYLLDANDGFITNETGQGASSEIVMCGITTIAEPYTYVDTNLDFLGNSTTYSADYTATQTLVVLDNVGRLWYIDEICGLRKSGNYFKDDNGTKISSKRCKCIAHSHCPGCTFVIVLTEQKGIICSLSITAYGGQNHYYDECCLSHDVRCLNGFYLLVPADPPLLLDPPELNPPPELLLL
jgi:hypothetical protein